MRSFGELESDIMRVIWHRASPITVREIVSELNNGDARNLAHTTVITVAERLRDKGWLSRQRSGRSYRYEALITEEGYTARLMSEVLDVAEDRPAVLLRFAEQLDPVEAATLRAALAESSGRTPGAED